MSGVECIVLCAGCLVAGRTLAALSSLERQYYALILSEVSPEPPAEPRLCWECRSEVRRCVYFREKAQTCYQILIQHGTEKPACEADLAREPRLSVHVAVATHVAPQHASDFTDESQTVVVSVNAKEEEQLLEVELEEVQLQTVKCETECESEWLGADHPIKKEEYSDYDDKECLFPADDSDDLAELESAVRACVRGDTSNNKSNSNSKSNNNSKGNNKINSSSKINRKINSNSNRVKKKKSDKEKKSERIVKSLARLKKKKQSLGKRCARKLPSDDKIRTLELSPDELLRERERDVRRDAYVRAEFKCRSCLVGFSYHKAYTEHLDTRHNQSRGDYSCPICKCVMATVESFTAHYKRHLRRYQCTVCGKRTMDRKVMTQHYLTAHEASTVKEYKCHCGKISHSMDAHRYHKDTHKARVECVECDKTFSHRAGLMNHRLSVHKLNNMFPCTLCEKVFRWKASLKKHLERHERKFRPPPDAPFCEPCGVSFSSVCTYQRHMKSSLKHVTENELKFICADCGRKFSNKTKLRDHIEEKHLHKTYTCSICSKPSKNRVCLDQHVRNVHRGRPNNKMCHHCGKGFPTKVQLESHIRSHTGERPFICEYCPTTFSQQSNLYKHNRQVHLNIKAKRYPPLCRKRKDKAPPPAPPPAPQPMHHAVTHDMYHLVM